MASAGLKRTDSNVVGHDLAAILPQNSAPWFRTPHLLQLNICIGVIFLSSTTMGFDGSMMNGLLSLDSWNLYFGRPNGTWLGLMNAVMPLGVLLAAFPAGWLSDRLGRRYTIIVGIFFLIIASALQGSAQNVGSFIVARFLIGVGIEFSCVPAPVLISEIAYPTHRGKATSLFQTCFYLGAICSSWTTFGTFNMSESTWSWRIPSILQAFFPILQLCGLYFVPESPRWLVAKGRTEEARNFLIKYYAGGDASHPLVDYEMQAIAENVRFDAEHDSEGWTQLWKTSADRKRLLIAVLTPMISQWSGNGIITYYLSLVLDSVGVKDSFSKTLINGILQIYNFFLAITGSVCVDKLGRRFLWLMSLAGMLVTFTIFTACSGSFKDTGNHATAITVIVFVFAFFFFYDIAVTPLTFAYPAEILPFPTRQKGLAVTNFCNGVALMFNSFVNPVAMEAIGWKYYLVYIGILVALLIAVYLFFVETKGYSLEETAHLFEGSWIVASWYKKKQGETVARSDERVGINGEGKDQARVVMVEELG